MTLLTLVPTPIGNLGDITLRAIEVLRSADVVAAEDTRHSGRLLQHLGIDRPLVRLDAHTIAHRAPAVLEAHDHVAFVTDAGTPGISDPGAELVALALRRGDRIESLPGPTAFVPALVLSGLPLARFTFEGFLPRKGGARRERLAEIAASRATTVLYESPRRLPATLRDLEAECGPEREASVSREISKRFETTYRGTLAELAVELESAQARGELKGEAVVVIAPASAEAPARDFAVEARRLSATGVRGQRLRDALMAAGAARNDAYRLALQVEDHDPGERER